MSAVSAETERFMSERYGVEWRKVMGRKIRENALSGMRKALDAAERNADIWKPAGVDADISTMVFFFRAQIEYWEAQQ